MKFPRPLICLLLLFSGGELSAAQTSVRATEFRSMSYPLEGRFFFKDGESFPVVHSTESGFYIHITSDHDRVIFLDNSESTLPARLNGDFLEFWEAYGLETDRAFLVFPPDRWYRVISETESKYKIEYVFADTRMHCSVAKAGFERGRHFIDAEGRLQDLEVENPKDAVCILEFPTGATGTGFLLYRGDRLYCYTNQHVVMNAGEMKIRMIDGTVLNKGALEVAEDVDLARIVIHSRRPGFDRVGQARLQDKVKVLGNSLGAGRVTILNGQVNGLSEKQVETSAKFVTGNSGSPIINGRGEVIGVATLLESFPDHQSILKGTDFEEGRRVGMRLDRDINWMEVDAGSYLSRNQSVIRAMAFLDELPFVMAVAVSNNFAQKLVAQQFQDRMVRQWLQARAQNMSAVVMKYKPAVDRGVRQRGNAFYYTSEFASIQKSYLSELIEVSEKYWHTLARNVSMKRRALSRHTPYPDTEYMREHVSNIVNMLDSAETAIGLIAETHREFAELQ